jgi:hypothetical protein
MSVNFYSRSIFGGRDGVGSDLRRTAEASAGQAE